MAEPARIPEWSLGERMAKARSWAGLDTHQMAALLEVHERTIRNWERDHTHVTKTTLIAYHWHTGVPLTWIEHGTAGDGGGEPSGGEAVTIGYPTRPRVRLLALAA